MNTHYKYSEERVVYADADLVWNLLSNCNYLPKWMPYIIKVEHLGNTHLEKGSILWVESLHDKRKKQSLCYVSECKEKNMISFLSKQNGTEVCFSFQIRDADNGLIKIVMTIEINLAWYQNFIFRNKLIQSIRAQGWVQLNELDKVIMECRNQQNNNLVF